MKRILIITITIFIVQTTFSQKGVIMGELVDYESGQPVVKAPVILYGTTLGVKSDAEGKFEFKNLKLENTELIIHGQSVLIFGTDEKSAENNNYFTLVLKNLKLSKNTKEIDLGILYMVNLYDEETFGKLPCKEFNNKFYKYRLIDGAERFQEGKRGILDFGETLEKCDKE